MCTLTLLRRPWLTDRREPPPLWRIVFNRDEQRSRPPALAPSLHTSGSIRTVYPVDPQGGGTWIAATEQGLVLALLNGNDVEPSGGEEAAARQSRGGIIPTLAAAGARTAAEVPIEAIDPRAWRPFHLVVADDREIREVSSDGRTLARMPPCVDDRLIRTSSSVETVAVCAWRRRLFAEHTPASAAEQDAFHARPEPEHPARGVNMSRPDASTISVTIVDVFSNAIRMTYRPLSGPEEESVTEIIRT